MKSFLAIVAFLLIAFTGCGGCVPQRINPYQDLQPDLRALEQSVVFVHAVSEMKGGGGRGSGVLIKEEAFPFVPDDYILALSTWHLFWDEDKESKSGIRLVSKALVSPIQEPPEETKWLKAVEAKIACFDAQWDLVALLLRKDWVEQRFGYEDEDYGVPVLSFDPPKGTKVWGIANSRRATKSH